MTENSGFWEDQNFQILYSPPSYDALDPTKNGAYKFVWDNSTVIAVAWTDFSMGAGLITIDGEDSVCYSVNNFLSDMASTEFPATQAYILIDTRAGTSDERTGILQDALDAANEVLNTGEIPAEKEDDLDE